MDSLMTFLTSLDGTITASSSRAPEICGAHSPIGCPITDILGNGDMLIANPASGPVNIQTVLLGRGESVDAKSELIETNEEACMLITIRTPEQKSEPTPGSGRSSATDLVLPAGNAKRVNLSEYAPQGLLLLTKDFEYIYANRALLTLVDRSADELQGRGWLSCLHSDDLPTLTEKQLVRGFGKEHSGENTRLISPLGATTWVRASVRQVTMADTPNAHYLVAFDDIDADKKLADRHMVDATRDTVTGLPNRLQFEREISRQVSAKSRLRSIVALMYIDLDGFKSVNDTYGHSCGDALLAEVASRLNEQSSRACIVARLGGDEFVVLLTDVRRMEEVKYLAEKINASLSEPFEINEVQVDVSCSIGIATHAKVVADRRSTDRIVGDLLRRADSAMYSAKHNGKNQYFLFGSEESGNINNSSVTLIKDVYSAIEHNDLCMEYQAQIETATNKVVGYEGLVRWRHPENGLIMPGEFIPLIENTGAMNELTRWIVQRVCHDYVTKLATNSSLVRPTVSINLSAIQLQDMSILKMINSIISREDVDPSDVVFEITEGILVSDPVAGRKGLEWLRENGYRTALDDFGTGYSSLSYLNDFPIDELKLDGSFIRDLETNENARTLVSGIIGLAHSLDLYVTAEGVEEASQLIFLDGQGCDRCQGYFFARPQSPQVIQALRAAL